MNQSNPAQRPANIERLYNLLPAIYRIRDEEGGGQLRALLAIIESEFNSIEGDIGDLYQNWFVETCADWVVPYLGDLLAVRDLSVASPRTYGQERRAYVANTLAYRQRKGTTPVLEQLAKDITGWGARASEALPLLATTQNLNHRRLNGMVNLRRGKRPERVGTPFEDLRDGVAYTTELPRIRGDRGRYNSASVAIYLWRLSSYPIEWGTAREIVPPPNVPGYYFAFDPVGNSAPLFNRPQTETELIQLATEINLPGILTRPTLKTALNSAPDSLEYRHYFGSQPAFQIQIAGTPEPIPPQSIQIGNLQWEDENWQLPPMPTDCDPVAPQVIVDPESGRLALFTPDAPDRVRVIYAYGFSGDIGGGAYERPQPISQRIAPRDRIRWDVTSNPLTPSAVSLTQAVTAWNKTAQNWQNCYDFTYIPIAYLAIDDNGEPTILEPIDRWHPQWHPQLQPGIQSGLQVIGNCGDLEVTVLPGIAVDSLGRPIHLNIRYSVILGDCANQDVWLVISQLQRAGTPQWQIDIVNPEVEANYPSHLYIRLAQISLDANGEVTKIDPVDRTETKFVPGILRGMNLSVAIDPRDREISVSVAGDPQTPGIAVNSQAQVLTLDRPISTSLAQLLDLQAAADCHNRRVILFLIPGAQPKLGAVIDAEIGIIRLGGNSTYDADLTLQIPATKQLHLIAANGDRPHLLGDIFLKGIANPDTIAGGGFWLDGVLLEGQLVVSSGNLQTLNIRHSTLVPSAGGIVVEKPEYDIVDEDATDITLLAMLMYSLTLFQRLLKVGLGKNTLSPQQRIARITDITFKQMTNAIDALQHTVQQWQSGSAPVERTDPEANNFDLDCGEPSTTDFDADNGRLNITIDRSICGSIALADTVPSLKIVDSTIDIGSQAAGFGAIAAAGTATEIQNTTVLGTTIVRSLEASNSIFRDKIVTLRQQVGCMRFCYVPTSSHTPPRYLCQPDLLLAETIGTPPASITSLAAESTQLVAGTAGNGVFYYRHIHKTWVPIKLGLNREIITALIDVSVDAIPYLLAGTASGMLAIANLPTETPGTGKITSRGNLVKGTGTSFLTQLMLGDTIVLAQQARTVVSIASSLELQIDRPFDRDLVTPQDFEFNHTQWLPIEPKPLKNTIITTLVAHTSAGKITIFASTAGSGVFRSEDARNWTQVSDGLSNLDIRTIAIDPNDGYLFVGTYGSGVFWSSDNGDTWNGGDPVDPEIRQSGLTDPQITTLTINPANGHIFAGTTGSGVFRSTDRGLHWEPVSRGLKHPQIAALIHDARSDLGTITTADTQVTFSNPEHILSLPNGNYTIVANGQTRLLNISTVADRQIQVLNDTFDPDLTTPTSFALIDLFAGTSDGGIYYSTDEGQLWQEISSGLSNTAITALTFSNCNGNRILCASTQIGSVIYLKNRTNWRALNTGLDRVDAGLGLLDRLQPDFTSVDYGQPGYLQLSSSCPIEIYTGAEDGAEMGVFNYLKQPQRAANLQASLAEYLRFGLKAKIIYIT
jgi:hypothetical protein